MSIPFEKNLADDRRSYVLASEKTKVTRYIPGRFGGFG